VVLRLGGIPLDATAFAAGRVSRRLRAERALRAAIDVDKASVCDLLAAEVPQLYGRDAAAARALIQVKRDLFNARLPAASAWARAQPQLPPSCAAAVEALCAALRELQELAAGNGAEHAAELETAYAEVLRAYGQPNLLHALALTNPAVHARLLQLGEGKHFPRKEYVQLCTSLGRYALRAAQKTSPLSSFGLVALGHWTDAAAAWPDDGPPLAPAGTVTHRLQPRFAALDYVFLELLADIRRIDGAAPVALNTSLRLDNGEYVWARIKNDDVPESRTRATWVAKNRSRAALAKLLSRIHDGRAPGDALTLDALREALLPAVGGDAARAGELLATAWDHALIQPALPACADPVEWAHAACACLRPALRAAVSAALAQFVAAIATHDRFDPGFTAAVEQHFEALLASAGLSVPVARFRPLVFEDCTLPAPAFGLSRGLLQAHERELVALLRCVPLLTSNTPLTQFRRLVVRRFRERFGADGLCTSVRDFVEACADEFDTLFAPAGGGDDKAAAFAELRSEPRSQELARLRRELLTDLAARARQGGDIVLSAAELDDYSTKAKGENPAPDASKMFFVQPVVAPEGPLLAVNHIYPGASCTFSRFLPHDAASMDKVRGYLQQISEQGRFVELGGIFGFNANLHAILADEVLSIPPFAPLKGPGISLDDLRLRHRAERDDLVFEDAQGQAVNIFFLGILTPLLMPRTYQVVRTLCFSSERVEDLGDQLAHFLAPDADGTLRIPRLRLGGLVLARRSLAVRKPELPDPALDEFAFFAAFTEWADRQDLPRWIFSKRTVMAALHRGADLQLPDWRSLPGKDAKPMPLDRECPLSVRIFQKNLAVSAPDVLFTEALPAPAQTCFSREGQAVAGELGIELTLKERG
jgi:Lantibiotic dehydratase, N terminus